MIKLAAHNLLLRNEDGLQTFQARALRARISRCCQEAGMQDLWIADHIVSFIEDYLHSLHQNGDPLPSAGDLDRMVAQVLLDAGYPEIAAAFVQEFGLTPFLGDGLPRQPWDRARVERVLYRNIPLHSQALERLVDLTIDRLRRLGFPVLADSLILQIARHVGPPSTGSEVVPGAENSPWLFHPEEWDRTLLGPAASFVQVGALRIKPVSRLLPAPRLRLDLERLGKLADSDPLTQLAVYPLLVQCCRAATELACGIQARIAETAAGRPYLQAHVEVCRMSELLERFTALPRTGRVRAAAEMREVIRRHALAAVTPPAAIVFC